MNEEQKKRFWKIYENTQKKNVFALETGDLEFLIDIIEAYMEVEALKIFEELK